MTDTAISVGVVGAVAYDERNDRTKGLLTELFSDVGRIAETIYKMASENQRGTRFTMRVLVSQEVDVATASRISIPWKQGALITCEAVIPVGRSKQLGAILYFGGNTPERVTGAKIVEAEWEQVSEVQKMPRKHSVQIPSEFQVEIIKQPTSNDVSDTLHIYRRAFSTYIADFTPELVSQMIANNVFAVVRNEDGKIVAVSQAEKARIKIGDEDWELYELSDTAVDPEYKKLGLGWACKALVLDELSRVSHSIVYAEPRANHRAILKLNHDLGLKLAGRLDQACVISSDLADIPQEGAYGNLFVFYLPR